MCDDYCESGFVEIWRVCEEDVVCGVFLEVCGFEQQLQLFVDFLLIDEFVEVCWVECFFDCEFGFVGGFGGIEWIRYVFGFFVLG